MPGKVSDDVKALRGTNRLNRERSVVDLYPNHLSRPDPDDLPPPADMTDSGKQIWVTKVERYRQRGQKVDGCQEALRQYCELEAKMIRLWKEGPHPTPSMLNCYLTYANNFTDTPASQRMIVSAGAKENPFVRNGKFKKQG